MSTNIIVSLAVNVLVAALPLLGVHIGTEQLTESLQTLILVGTGIVTFVEHKKVSDIAQGIR